MVSPAVERYLLGFNDALVAGAGRRERILAEVEDHLRDSVASLIERGLAVEAAEAEAVARFGAPAEAAERFGPDPLGWAQRASGWFDGWRVAHPWVVTVITVSMAIAPTLWLSGLTAALALGLPLLVMVAALNLALRRRTEPGYRARSVGLWRERRWLAVALVWIPVSAIVVLTEVVNPTTTWFRAIVLYYLVCAAAVYWARPRCCLDPGCIGCATRWAASHRLAAAGVRYAGWALALAGPALAAVVPVAAGRSGTALGALTVFVAVAPLPRRRGQHWLRRRRPAAVVALRSAPILALEVVLTVFRDPSHWLMLLIIGTLAAYLAITREIWWSRSRSDETRRRLHARTRELADGGAPG